MILFRITNATLLLMAAIWWLMNRHSDMAEPLCAVVGALIAIMEIVGELLFRRHQAQRQAEKLLEDSILPDLLDRIHREEKNIQQVIAGKRKGDEVIEEFPIKLLTPQVEKLRQLRRFSRFALPLQREIDINNRLASGEKQFCELQKVLTSIKGEANRPPSDKWPNWMPWIVSASIISFGLFLLNTVRLPQQEGIGDVENRLFRTVDQKAVTSSSNPNTDSKSSE
jgi:hypothetical protein